MVATLDHIHEEADTIRTFWFRLAKPLRYTAGQFIELTLKHDNPDDRGEKRWFTLSSAPGHELVSITTRYAGDDRSSSFKKTLFALKPGAELHMSEPMGDFVLPKDSHIPLIFVAGGIGLTPFHSMFMHLAEQHEHRDIKFLYSVRNEEDIIFQDAFNAANIHATIVVEEPSTAWGGERGRITPEQILGLTDPSSDSLIYLSGPEPMIEALASGLHVAGIPKRQLVTDYFPGYVKI
jgi:ferredoxin-NADP reductase